MNNYIIIRFFILACFYQSTQLLADPVVTFFFKPYPTYDIATQAQNTANRISTGGKLAKRSVKEIAGNGRRLSGIFATYAGFLTASDPIGQVVLPRKHTKPVLNILVTNKLTPIIRSGNTLAHWELPPEADAQMYTSEKKYDNDSKLWYWEIQDAPLPEDRIIPLETLTIIAQPKNIYVPRGITLSEESPHLILPDIYVKKGIDLTGNALYMLNLNHYFGQILFLYKKGKEDYLEHITY